MIENLLNLFVSQSHNKYLYLLWFSDPLRIYFYTYFLSIYLFILEPHSNIRLKYYPLPLLFWLSAKFNKVFLFINPNLRAASSEQTIFNPCLFSIFLIYEDASCNES